MWKKIIFVLIFIIVATIFLKIIPNKSNFPEEIVIPIIVALITKYSLGDLDKGYKYTILDIFYWILILLVSYLIVIYLPVNYF
jgi:hypothetical protein